ncbi:MAG: CBS domain-containing protein [Peptococcaceae bacterium]|nr:CBS domain-containing protein [Peptococcaceae bacterium]
MQEKQEKKETIRDFMVSLADYPTVHEDATLEQAVNIMYRMAREKGYRWLVVLDGRGGIKGFLTLRNVMEAISNLAPKAGGWMGIFTYSRPGFFYWEGVQAIKDTPVKKCIKPLVDVFVKETDYPAQAAELILNRRITIVPVVDDGGNVVGIVRPVDLLPFFKNLFDHAPA